MTDEPRAPGTAPPEGGMPPPAEDVDIEAMLARAHADARLLDAVTSFGRLVEAPDEAADRGPSAQERVIAALGTDLHEAVVRRLREAWLRR